MRRFNLLDDPWISVVRNDGVVEEISLIDLFENANKYVDLAGDNRTQDFAVLRILLSVMHTVFSRFDANGKQYEYLKLDEKMRQCDKLDELNLEEHRQRLYKTWFALWKAGKFPKIISEYLERWRDSFFLFDESKPFFQVVSGDVDATKISKETPSQVYGKNINRLVSESGNKVALFSPRSDSFSYKERLNSSEVARWLLTFHGYTGLADKVIFGSEKYKASKGWLFDIGGIYFKGSNLFETLMLNCVLDCNEKNNLINVQTPCWEYESSEDCINAYFPFNSPDNLAALYTAWSRAVYINPAFEDDSPFECYIVKLPEIEHGNAFLEPMTIWRYSKEAGVYTPKKHQLNKSMWRSFGFITVDDEENKRRKPGIINWLSHLKEYAGNNSIEFEDMDFTLCAVSMEDDGNATSWLPTDEVIDSLTIMDFLLNDSDDDYWVDRINAVVSETRTVVERVYKNFIQDIKKIRGIETGTFVDIKVEELYFNIDHAFRIWISSIRRGDDQDEKAVEWKSSLKRLVLRQADEIMQNGSTRDYMGIKDKDKNFNIAVAYNNFRYYLKKSLKV